MNKIYEVPVYCGAMKVWRILNLNTGTIYCLEYPDFDAAYKSIEVGQIRAGCVVEAKTKNDLLDALRWVKA